MNCNKTPVSLTFSSLNVIFVMENYEERSVLFFRRQVKGKQVRDLYELVTVSEYIDHVLAQNLRLC